MVRIRVRVSGTHCVNECLHKDRIARVCVFTVGLFVYASLGYINLTPLEEPKHLTHVYLSTLPRGGLHYHYLPLTQRPIVSLYLQNRVGLSFNDNESPTPQCLPSSWPVGQRSWKPDNVTQIR